MVRSAAKKKEPLPLRSSRTGRGRAAGSKTSQFKKGNAGGKKGRKNKVTVKQRETARQLFTPLAEVALSKGKKHLDDCKLDGCAVCIQWAKISFEYAYGKPTQPIEIDASALRTELEAIAAAAGKSVEEIEREAYDLGVRVMANYR